MKAYKFKIKRPNKIVVANFNQTLDLCRELYNAGLQERRDAWKLNRVSVSYTEQANQLSDIKTIREDLKAVHSQILQDTLRRLDKTFNSYFQRLKKGEKTGFPRFKGSSRFKSFTFPQSGFSFHGDQLRLSKIGTVRIRLSREIRGLIKTCTVKREVSGWYVIFTVENQKELLEKTGESVGLDVGIESFATLSDGSKIENPRFLYKSERRLKRAQRALSRKKKSSQNRKKSVYLLKKQFSKVTRQRHDFLHKLSNNLVLRFDEIAVEELQITKMMKDRHFAKAIKDASWGCFFNILFFKAENAGKRVWKVNARNTSQICSNCGSLIPKNLDVRIHNCTVCHLRIDRDENAAINIKGRADLLGMRQATVADEPRISSRKPKNT